jgi:Fibronectin type III domain
MGERQAAPDKPDRKGINWAVWLAAAGVLVPAVAGYLALAATVKWWPFRQPCVAIVNAKPSHVSRSNAGADPAGNGRARVFWRAPGCGASDPPITGYSVDAWWFMGGQQKSCSDFTSPKVVKTVRVPASQTSVVITGLVNGHHYDFGITAYNAAGGSGPTFTNIVVPPRGLCA